jgi:hypothetical protein
MRLRLEYDVRVGDETGSLLEVSDGQVLWTRHIIGAAEEAEAKDGDTPSTAEPQAAESAPTTEAPPPGQLPATNSTETKKQDNVRITRRDVGKIRKAGLENPNVPERVLIVELGLGGLPALLASIEDNMQFSTVHEEQIDGQSVTVIEGTWTQASFERFGGKSANQRLPDHIPEKVRIYFDSATLFPRRILYLKQDLVRSFFRPMLTLDFVNVALDGPIDEMAFHFEPPEGVIPNDITELYLKQLAAGAPKFEPVEGAEPQPGGEQQPAAEQPQGETAAPADQPTQN